MKPTLFIHLSNGSWGAVLVETGRNGKVTRKGIRKANSLYAVLRKHFGATGFQFCKSGDLREALPSGGHIVPLDH